MVVFEQNKGFTDSWTMCTISLPIVVTVVGTVVATTLMYLRKRTKKSTDGCPKLFYKESHLTTYLLRKCAGLTRPFRPSLWLQSRHAQTLLIAIYPKPKVDYVREYLTMDDGGQVAIDWIDPEQTQTSLHDASPILIVLPGMTGDASSVAEICLEGSKKGYRAVVFNKRGHGGSILTTPMLQSFGDTSDLRPAIEFIRGRYPLAELTGVGFSAGSGLLVSYLGEFGSSTYLRAAVCVSPGYDTWQLFAQHNLGFYDYCLLLCLKGLLKSHSKILSQVIDVKAAMASKTIKEFDEAVYCKLYGYNSLKDYWDKNNPMRDLGNVTVPVLCISSLDDPICLAENIPFEIFDIYHNCILAATERGGHCGFMEGLPPRPWANTIAIEYISTVREYFAQTDENIDQLPN